MVLIFKRKKVDELELLRMTLKLSVQLYGKESMKHMRIILKVATILMEKKFRG
jgi:hypothetical protein